MARSPLSWLALLALATASPSIGCSGDRPQCEVDPALLDTDRACVRDEDCPCGSGCLYGRCEAACRADSQCGAGERCNTFGQCVTPNAAPQVANLGGIRLSSDTLALDADLDTRAVAISAPPGKRLRVVATEPLEVTCDGDGFTRDCFLEVGDDGHAVVKARLADAAASGTGSVAVYPKRGRPAFIWVRFGEAAVEWGPLPSGGRFAGTLRLERGGALGLPDSTTLDGLPAVPINAELYPGASRQVLVFYDGFGVLNPDRRWVARLEGDRLFVPAWPMLRWDRAGAPETEIVAGWSSRPLEVSANRLAFEIELSLVGGTSAAPLLRGVIDLRRVDGAPAGEPPAVPPGYVSPFGDGRWEIPAPGSWEEAADILCGTGGCTPEHEGWFACDEDLLDPPQPDVYSPQESVDLSGAPLCSAGQRAFAPSLFNTLDRIASGVEFAPRDTIAEACWADLGAWIDGPTGSSSQSPHTCLNPLRIGGRLAALTDAVLADSPDTALLDRAHRLVQQYLEVVTYTVTELDRARRYQAALAADCDDRCVDLPTPDELASRPLRAVDWLFHPRGLHLLQRLAESEADASAGPSLAYSIARLAAQHVVMLESLLRERHRTGEPAPPDGPLANALRDVLLLRALAAAAMAWVPKPVDSAEFDAIDSELKRFDRSYADALARLVAIREGADFFGIAPGQVPLYLDRDVDQPEARAFALTNYLLDPEGRNWIGQAVADAAAARDAVRDAWARTLMLDATAVATAADEARFRSEAARSYGTRMQALCPVDDLADAELAEAVATQQRFLDPNRCFLDTEDAACAEFATPSPLSAHLVLRDVCIAARARAASSHAGVPGSDDANAFLDAMRDALAQGALARAEPEGDGWSVQVGETQYLFTEEQLASLDFGVDSLASDRALSGFEGFSPSSPDSSPSSIEDLDGFGWLADAQQFCTALADAAEGGEPPVQPAAPEALDRAECYRGGLGEAALETRAAHTEFKAAQARIEEHYDRYRIAVGICTLQSQAREAVAQETARFEESVAGLRKKIAGLRRAANVFDFVSGSTANTATSSSFEGVSKNIAKGAAAVTGVAGLASGVLGMVADHFQEELDEKTAEHDAFVEQIEAERDLRQCMAEASRELVGLRTATLELQRSVQRLGSAVLRFENLKRELLNLQRSVTVALAERHAAAPYRGSLWIDSSVESFERRMRLARRVTYLAAIAVDYERQTCNADDFRGRILRSETPEDLESVRADMLASVANRQIGNGTVGDAFIVLSLRDDILQLADRHDTAPGEPRLDAVARLRNFLLDPRFAVYEGDRYAGQLIPFDLVPPTQPVEGYGVGQGYFSQNHCAERLWSVNVGIVGREGVSGNSTLARLDVLKANDFSSQWCRPEAACTPSPFQVAGINPAVNLFLDPDLQPGFLQMSAGEVAPFSRVVLTGVRTDVSRADMERSDYAQGAQRGFAGRGLFGQYALFFPADALALQCDDQPCSSSPNALDLQKVTDILIRFDYVAGVRP